MQRSVVALLLMIPALAGCLAGDDDAPPGNGSNVGTNSDFELPFHFTELDPGHDHSDPFQHDIANNMTLEAFLPLGSDGAPGSISEMHVAGDWIFQGVMGHGFQIIDISNPTAPELVITYDMADDVTDDEVAGTRGDVNEQYPGCPVDPPEPVPVNCPSGVPGIPTDRYLADIKSDDAGDWLFVALELTSNPGVFVYDVRDKANPVFAGFYPAPGAPPGTLLGCHMIEYALIGSNEYLFCVPLDDSVYIAQIQSPDASGMRQVVNVQRWVPFDAESSPNDFSTIQENPQGAGDFSVLGGHQDMTWQKDPLTGADVISVSLWDLGWYWVDVSDPLNPTMLGYWKGEGSPDYDGQTHTMMLMESDGRRLAVGIPEVARPPVVHILDITDYEAPEVVAHWNAVGEWYNEDGRYSTHNFQIVDGKMYMTHYHAGTMVLDISTAEKQAAPEILGTFMPFDRRPETYGNGCCGGSWDVVVSDGYTFTANKHGLYVLLLEGDPAGKASHTGFA